ncbi:MAG TPA: lactate utilization protein C [Terracidiphilus sp.]|nr:lactate utilization protein C [Terracidiphilus sp.]
MSEVRQQILDRIRRAVSERVSVTPGDLVRDYQQHDHLDRHACIALMIDRLREYDAEVFECLPAELSACISDCLSKSKKRTFVVPQGLPGEWMLRGFTWKIDQDLSHAAIENSDGVVTGCFAGIADSGTIVLHHSPQEGRRVISLLPDWHLCILRTSQIVEVLPQYFALCAEPPRLATYISGPSATADIEMTRIKGVHGPRFLNVIVVHDEVLD